MVEKPQSTEAAGSVKREAEAEDSPAAQVAASEKPSITPDKSAIEADPPGSSGTSQAERPITATQDAALPDAVVERTKAVVGELNSRTRAALEKSVKIGEELSDVARGNVEAIVASSHAVADGAETLGRHAADYGKRRVERATAALSSLVAARTPAEMIDVQSDYIRRSLDDALTQASLFGNIWAKVAHDVVDPLSSRYAAAAEKMLIVAK
jgi:hypothetical protein